MRGAWISWLLASTLLPTTPFLLIGKRGLDQGMGLIPMALLFQLGCSIWLAVLMARKLRRGTGHVILMSFAFFFASVVIGCVSFFAACVGLGAAMNFH